MAQSRASARRRSPSRKPSVPFTPNLAVRILSGDVANADRDIQLLATTDRCALDILESDPPVGVLWNDSHETQLRRVMRKVNGVDDVFETIDVGLNGNSDLHSHVTWAIVAAYYLGLSIGLRLAGGAR